MEVPATAADQCDLADAGLRKENGPGRRARGPLMRILVELTTPDTVPPFKAKKQGHPSHSRDSR
jgi:hypothetical protein